MLDFLVHIDVLFLVTANNSKVTVIFIYPHHLNIQIVSLTIKHVNFHKNTVIDDNEKKTLFPLRKT